jgi:hypothetical protein
MYQQNEQLWKRFLKFAKIAKFAKKQKKSTWARIEILCAGKCTGKL